MKVDWPSLCRAPDRQVRIAGDYAVVTFENGRTHRVLVRETDDAVELCAIVAAKAAVADIPNLPTRLWRHNRAAQLVSFRIDEWGRVFAQGWVPKAGLTAGEFQLVLRRVAAESDRLEFLLTGRDTQ